MAKTTILVTKRNDSISGKAYSTKAPFIFCPAGIATLKT
jgi:hypothetical protein